MTNSYSRDWYGIFLDGVGDASTEAEVAFVQRHLPPAEFPYLLDLCCGPARHATHLVARGYDILGLDANEKAIREARGACPQGRFEVGDMRALDTLGQTFDGVLNLWHSFGYFDDQTNRDVLRQVHDVLRPGGRAVFDIYNREHFAQRPLVETTVRSGRSIRTTRRWDGPRHHVVLEYDGQPGDIFEWRLYTPAEFQEVCRSVGLHSLRSCAWFDDGIPPSPEHARMQFVLERRQRIHAQCCRSRSGVKLAGAVLVTLSGRGAPTIREKGTARTIASRPITATGTVMLPKTCRLDARRDHVL